MSILQQPNFLSYSNSTILKKTIVSVLLGDIVYKNLF